MAPTSVAEAVRPQQAVAELLFQPYRLGPFTLPNRIPGLGAIEKGKAPDASAEQMLALIREKYSGTLIVAGGFDRDTAEAWLEQSKADLIAFGRKFLANPDLPDRLRMPTGQSRR